MPENPEGQKEVKVIYDKEKNYAKIVLSDDTRIVMFQKTKTVSFMYPKEKFIQIFEKQIKNGNTHIGVEFSESEMGELLTGLGILMEKMEEDNNEFQEDL